MKLLHRILTPILTVLIFPAVIFLPMLRVVISSGLLQGETKINLLDNFGIGEFISLKDMYMLYKNGISESAGTLKMIWDAIAEDKKQEILDMLPGMHWIIIAVVFLVIALLVALALIVVSAATKKTGASIVLSLAGIVSALIMNASFNAFASPFLNGEISLNSILGNTNQMLGALLGNALTFDYMQLGIAYTAIILIFVCTFIISLCAHMEKKNGGK